jgi:hypothetical protein
MPISAKNGIGGLFSMCVCLSLACLSVLPLGCVGVEPVGAPLSGQRLFERVKHYASLGEHRTGDVADRETSQWLAEELTSLGFAVERQPFSVTQFFPAEQRLEVEGKSISVFPHWLPETTKAPIEAPLAPLGSEELSGKIAYLAPELAGEWYRVRPSKAAETAAGKGALALAIALTHPSGEIYATNAAPPFLGQRLPIPTVILAAQDAPSLAAAMESGAPATLLSAGEHRTVEATNVIARYPATPVPGAPWIVVSTPTSGWFRCAGERGGGVALWLGLAEWVAGSDGAAARNWLFVANSGHELSFAGAHQSMGLVPPPEDVGAWLHLGASIGARKWAYEGGDLEPLERVHDFNRLFYAPELKPLAESAFSSVPDLEVLPATELRRAHSELGEILHAGYSAMGFVGPHRFFHTPRDTPEVTSPALLAPYGEALRAFAQGVEQP